VNFFSLAFDFKKNRYGLLGGDKIWRLLNDIFGDRTFGDVPAELYIGATDFSNGERVILNSGKICDAVRASISVPMVFEPFYHAQLKRWLVDGGLTQNFPLDLAMERYRGARILAVDVATHLSPRVDFSEKRRFWRASRLSGLNESLQRTIRIFLLNQQAHFKSDPRVTKIVPDLEGFTAFDALRLEQIVQAGENAASQSGIMV
jgi:NTE family protein